MNKRIIISVIVLIGVIVLSFGLYLWWGGQSEKHSTEEFEIGCPLKFDTLKIDTIYKFEIAGKEYSVFNSLYFVYPSDSFGSAKSAILQRNVLGAFLSTYYRYYREHVSILDYYATAINIMLGTENPSLWIEKYFNILIEKYVDNHITHIVETLDNYRDESGIPTFNGVRLHIGGVKILAIPNYYTNEMILYDRGSFCELFDLHTGKQYLISDIFISNPIYNVEGVVEGVNVELFYRELIPTLDISDFRLHYNGDISIYDDNGTSYRFDAETILPCLKKGTAVYKFIENELNNKEKL
ncbi:MAG: hypothetical protein LBR36_00140 [Bacteroidales bacterium]|jgi:hypothetical protein|nr:hypothetical protein [Bacteroidales bacterium]